jgi:SAM-dependent methyltransferase
MQSALHEEILYRASEMKNTELQDIHLHRSILNELGYEISQNSLILDFGCGRGERVQEYRDAGFKAFGVDIAIGKESDYLHIIDTKKGYRIPFPEETFDFVFSESVFEHVQNYSDAVAEIWRVLKPDGFSLHFFPPKWKPIESHVFIPLGGVFQAYPWLLIWAFFGIRNSYQRGLTFREVARGNRDYLRNKTHYLSKKEIYEHILAHFRTVISAEAYLIKHSYGRARLLNPLVRVCPFIVPLYSSFHSRVVFFTKR